MKIQNISIWIFILFCFLQTFLTSFEFTNPFDYARITDVEYTAILNDEPRE